MVSRLSSRARRLLTTLISVETGVPFDHPDGHAVADLEAEGLAARGPDGRVRATDAGRAHHSRHLAAREGAADPFLSQHRPLELTDLEGPHGRTRVQVDTAESPLAWLARRKGRAGERLVSAEQLHAGERLRAEFTRAQMTPRVTSNWNAAVRSGRTGDSNANLADTVIAARQRVRVALEAVGPEFAGLLLDVCCFLKGLEAIERERQWPARSAKVVLQLGLSRLARHYGLSGEARGPARAHVRTWAAPDDVVEFVQAGSGRNG